MGGPAADSAAHVLAPVRVVVNGGKASVRPANIDAPARVRARVAAHDEERHKRPGPAHQQFHDDIAASVRVLRDRDGVPLTDNQLRDWTASLVATITGRYTVQELQPARTNTFAEEE